MEPDVSFVGVKLLPGKLTKVGGITNPESSIWTIHITQFALAPGAISGKNIVSIVQDDGESFALGTLEKDRCDQFQGDFMLSQEVEFVNRGKSEVHLTGYQTTTVVMDPEADLESDEEDDIDMDQHILGRRRHAALKAMEAGSNGLPEDDDSEDEDEDFDAAEEEEDDDIDDDSDDEEAPEGVPLAASERRKLNKALKQGKRAFEQADDGESESELDNEEAELLKDAALEGIDSEDDVDDDDEEDSDVDLENDDKVEEKQLQTASKILKQQKRGAETEKSTPQPNKKIKIDTASPAVSDGDKQWGKAIKAYLAKEGPTPISNLGSHVKKPPGVNRKLKRLLEDSKEFDIDAKGLVSLLK